jgi:hypothetical protein
VAEPDEPPVAWCCIDGRILFLDLKEDRYFRLEQNEESELLDRLADGACEQWHQPSILPRPQDWKPPTTSPEPNKNGRFNLSRVAKAIWLQRRVEARLESQNFLNLLLEFRRLRDSRAAQPEPLSSSGRALIEGFDHARLIRSSVDRCLPRSIALALGLARLGDRCNIVLGVTAAPFTAHCWAQQGDVVLNDTIEEVLRCTPILVV